MTISSVNWIITTTTTNNAIILWKIYVIPKQKHILEKTINLWNVLLNYEQKIIDYYVKKNQIDLYLID